MTPLVSLLAWLLAATLPQASAAEPDPHPAHATNGFSLGVVVGDPTGLTLRGGIAQRHAIQAHFGFSPFPGDAAVGMVDWTYEPVDLLHENNTASLLLFFGLGGKVEWLAGRYYAYGRRAIVFDDPTRVGLGARGVLGLRASFHDAPFDIFFEAAPVGILFIAGHRGAYYDFDVATGARYRF